MKIKYAPSKSSRFYSLLYVFVDGFAVFVKSVDIRTCEYELTNDILQAEKIYEEEKAINYTQSLQSNGLHVHELPCYDNAVRLT